MTDSAIIAASYGAEKSYTHNPDDIIDASDAVGAWGTAKESTTELVDLSGNGNIATIHGAMPTEGFIQGRRFTTANENYLDCGNDSSLDITDAITMETWIKSLNNIEDETNDKMIMEKGASYGLKFDADDTDKLLFYFHDGVTWRRGYSTKTSWSANTWYHIVVTFQKPNVVIYVNAVSDNTESLNYSIADSAVVLRIGTNGVETFNGSIDSVCIYNRALSVEEIESNFNTLARLPFWSVNYTDYPDNTTEYTDNLPYSSSIINSGTFKVDDDKLQCVSAGTMTYSASYNFDGSEYIKVEIDGVEYAGTGTITQGNTTVSVAQGSNKITIAMGTANTIDNIDIQFREEV